jgi:SAM-dependent methyltransferase
MADDLPWQLQMFDVSLKKRQKLAMLARMLGPIAGERCLLVTNGDNPGSINHHLRALGGSWTWCELEEDGIPGVERFLGEKVHHGTPAALPFPNASFSRVVVIDVHEHIEDTDAMNREIARVLQPSGIAIVTTPNGNASLPVVRLKHLVGMDARSYGHLVIGYRKEELAAMMRGAGLEPTGDDAYARFFTEFAELAINFGYMRVLARKKGRKPPDGEIAPRNADQLQSVGPAFRLYQRLFPLVRAFAALDALIPGRGGYAVAVSARRPT